MRLSLRYTDETGLVQTRPHAVVQQMNVGVFYGSTTGNTRMIAEQIASDLRPALCANICDRDIRELEHFDVLVIGASTWCLGDLQHDWQTIFSRFDELDLRGTRVALFGAGDQREYADTFTDAMGVLYDKLVERGAIGGYGFWSTRGYSHVASKSQRGDAFCGLALDQENQAHLTSARISTWCDQLRDELALPMGLRRAV